MANLNKLLVHVPSELCDGFKNKYVNGPEENRNKSYDGKIVFLEKTQEIFTKGKIYSTSVIDFSSLKELVGELPSGIDSTNIADYIGEVKVELLGTDDYDSSKDTIWGAKAYAAHIGEELIGDAISDTWSNNTIQGAKRYAEYVSSNVIAGTGIKVKEDITSYDNGGEKKTFTISNSGVTSVDTAASSGVALTYTDGKVGVNVTPGSVKEGDNSVVTGGAVYEAASKVAAKLPTVSQGTGITVTPTEDSNGKINYEISTYPDIFHYKGNKTTISELPTSDKNTKGDVWSVGTDGASGSVLYAWDGDEWINIGSPNSVTGVNTTSSHGVSLSRTQDGRVQVNISPGSVTKGNDEVVTGGTVYTEIQKYEPKGTAQGLINGLPEHTETYNSSYINVSVTTSKGQVSKVSVSETSDLTKAVSYANNSLQSVSVLGYTLTKGNSSLTVDKAKRLLGLGGAAFKDISYFDTAGTAQGLIDGLGLTEAYGYSSYVNVGVSTYRGKIYSIDVSPTDALIESCTYAKNAVQTIDVESPYLDIYDVAGYGGREVYLNFDETEVFNYVSNNVWETYTE